MKFEFTDKPSYLAWRQQWRADYKTLSEQIRALKRCRKMFVNSYRRKMTPNGPVKELISREPNPLHNPVETWKLAGLRSQAEFMMVHLSEAKGLSWSMKQEAKKAASVGHAA